MPRSKEEPIEPEQHARFLQALVVLHHLGHRLRAGAASAAAISYPLRITTIMKRIHISFIIDSRQHWLAH